MTKFGLFDIESIKNCIRDSCNKTIDDQLSEYGYTDDYKIRCMNIKEAERLIGLMDTLKEKNV